jgi:hypothetical protein
MLRRAGRAWIEDGALVWASVLSLESQSVVAGVAILATA